MIYFAVQTHNFQLRLAWQLSSILEQEDAPEIVIDIAHMPLNGKPTTEFLCHKFRNKGLSIRETAVEDADVFAKRGIVRNLQIENAVLYGADWMFFADCDNVYPPDFFRCLQAKLDEIGEDHEGVLYSKEKWHTEPGKTTLHVQLAAVNPVIRFPYRRALQIDRMSKANKSVAAGCMQVVSMKRLIESGGYYVEASKCRDSHLFRHGQRAKSDIQFRRRMGGSNRIKLACEHQLHLGHSRDKEVGYHIEYQR